MGDRRIGRKGFTLIELLVAISVLAVVAVLGWRGLDGIVRARIALNAELDKTRGMQLAFAQMQSDCAHFAKAEDIGWPTTLLAKDEILAMVRTVFADNEPSRLQVVAYRIRNGALVRQESIATRDLKVLDASWRAAAEDSEMGPSVLLQSGVNAMMVQSWYMDAAGVRAPGNGSGSPPPLPIGLEVSLQLHGISASMSKVFLLGAV